MALFGDIWADDKLFASLLLSNQQYFANKLIVKLFDDVEIILLIDGWSSLLFGLLFWRLVDNAGEWLLGECFGGVLWGIFSLLLGYLLSGLGTAN